MITRSSVLLALSEEISDGRDDGVATPACVAGSQQVQSRGSSATN